MQNEKAKICLLNSLRSALIHQFYELSECDNIDIRFLWEEHKKCRYRVNGFDSSQSKIVFSIFVIAWDDIKGIQYEVLNSRETKHDLWKST